MAVIQELVRTEVPVPKHTQAQLEFRAGNKLNLAVFRFSLEQGPGYIQRGVVGNLEFPSSCDEELGRDVVPEGEGVLARDREVGLAVGMVVDLGLPGGVEDEPAVPVSLWIGGIFRDNVARFTKGICDGY